MFAAFAAVWAEKMILVLAADVSIVPCHMGAADVALEHLVIMGIAAAGADIRPIVLVPEIPVIDGLLELPPRLIASEHVILLSVQRLLFRELIAHVCRIADGLDQIQLFVAANL